MSSRASFEHDVLLSSSSLDHDVEKEDAFSYTPYLRPRFSKTLIFSLILNLFFFLYVITLHGRGSCNVLGGSVSETIEWRGAKPVYTPAQEAITHVVKVSGTFTSQSEFNGPPSKKVDKAWSMSYEPYLTSAVPRDQAALMANQTERVPGDGPPRYIAGLDVFHQMHCLDRIRQALYPKHYGTHLHDWRRDEEKPHDGEHEAHESYNQTQYKPPPPPPRQPGEPPFDHIDHCIQSLRESIMCSGDATPVVYQWDEGLKMSWARLNIPHTCVDYSALQAWATKWRPRHYIPWDERTPDNWTWTPPVQY